MSKYFPCSHTNSAIFLAHNTKPHLRSMKSNGTLRVFVFHSSGLGRIEEKEERTADSELNSTHFSPGNTKFRPFSTKRAGKSILSISLLNKEQNLTFVCPCIFCIIVNDDQQDATILAYLFIPNQL